MTALEEAQQYVNQALEGKLSKDDACWEIGLIIVVGEITMSEGYALMDKLK